MYLRRGVGTLGAVDDDIVSLSTAAPDYPHHADIGRRKVDSAPK